MKQIVNQKILQLQSKYSFKKRKSFLINLENERKVKTEPKQSSQTQYEQTNQDTDKGYKSQLIEKRRSVSYLNMSNLREYHNIGKKYFQLPILKDKIHPFYCESGSSHQLRKLTPNFKTQSYLPNAFKSASKQLIKKYDYQIQQKALQKVKQIYSFEQNYVQLKYQKIQKIKNRLRLLDKISNDKQKLKNKIIKLSAI